MGLGLGWAGVGLDQAHGAHLGAGGRAEGQQEEVGDLVRVRLRVRVRVRVRARVRVGLGVGLGSGSGLGLLGTREQRRRT